MSNRRFGPVGALGLCVLLLGFASGCGSESAKTPATTPPKLVAPEGAVYAYRVPTGFKAVPGKGPGQHLTTIVPASLPDHSGTIAAFEVTPQGSFAGTDRLLATLDREELAFYRGRGASLAAGERTTIAGQPAICWRIHHFQNSFDGLVEADACAIVAGGVIVQQGCTWKPAAREIILRGCKALRAGLQISS